MEMSGWNLPPGVRERDIPGWDAGDPLDCQECGEKEVGAENICPECGERVWTEEELDEAARDAADEAKFDQMRDEGML